jgi:hypothetical protein
VANNHIIIAIAVDVGEEGDVSGLPAEGAELFLAVVVVYQDAPNAAILVIIRDIGDTVALDVAGKRDAVLAVDPRLKCCR